MTNKRLKDILEKHTLWLEGDPAGVRANLSGAKMPMYCKWGASVISNKIRIGCVQKTADEWESWLDSDQQYETKRGTPEFKQIEAVIRAHITYLKYLNQ